NARNRSRFGKRSPLEGRLARRRRRGSAEQTAFVEDEHRTLCSRRLRAGLDQLLEQAIESQLLGERPRRLEEAEIVQRGRSRRGRAAPQTSRKLQGRELPVQELRLRRCSPQAIAVQRRAQVEPRHSIGAACPVETTAQLVSKRLVLRESFAS